MMQIQTEFSRLAIFYGGYPQVERKSLRPACSRQGFPLNGGRLCVRDSPSGLSANNNFAPLLRNGHKAARRYRQA